MTTNSFEDALALEAARDSELQRQASMPIHWRYFEDASKEGEHMDDERCWEAAAARLAKDREQTVNVLRDIGRATVGYSEYSQEYAWNARIRSVLRDLGELE